MQIKRRDEGERCKERGGREGVGERQRQRQRESDKFSVSHENIRV